MAVATKPDMRPANPNFSSGPCAKRPGFTLDALSGAFLGRSHRAAAPKARLAKVIDRSRAELDGERDRALFGELVAVQAEREVRQRPSRRAMKASRSNRCTSCSFLINAPCSGGMSRFGSRSRNVSAEMSSTIKSFSQSRSSDVDGFFFIPGTSRIS